VVSQWTNKAYDFTSSDPIPFPNRLAESCKYIVKGIPWDEVFGNIDDVCGDGYEEGGRIRPDGYENWGEDYCELSEVVYDDNRLTPAFSIVLGPDTGIVNFYQTRDTLMGHVDRSELDPYRPLISIS
jgi:alkylated DNA repair protein alkB family protein 1